MYIIICLIFGIIFGSFVNALVWRLHEQAGLTQEGQSKKGKGQNKRSKQTLPLAVSPEDLSIMKGRSMCPNCHHSLAAKDLVPVLSWLQLRAKCRYCHAPISWQYPLVELLTAALFVLAYLAWPLGFHGVGLFQFVLCLLFIVFFMALAIYDLRGVLLPDRVVFPLIAVAALEVVTVAVWKHSFSALWQPVAGAAVIFGLFWLLYQVSKGAWIGGGDVKLALVLGLLAASPLRAFLVIFFASLLGTLVSAPLLARGKQGLQLRIPFGPYLLAASLVVQLYGTHIIHWYQNLLTI